jgi:thiosulfate reductase cytochrome b subunit
MMTNSLPSSKHPILVRITHGVNGLAFLIMLTSGWRIYNASPLFHFAFPEALTLGGWLGGALLWHFAAMWLLAFNGLVYLAYGLFFGRFRRQLWPISLPGMAADIRAAFKGTLQHDHATVYNNAQRAVYVLMIGLGVALVLSGLVVWKSVQFQALGTIMGGYEGARLVHFSAMAIITMLALVHVVMVIRTPHTLTVMFWGRRS